MQYLPCRMVILPILICCVTAYILPESVDPKSVDVKLLTYSAEPYASPDPARESPYQSPYPIRGNANTSHQIRDFIPIKSNPNNYQVRYSKNDTNDEFQPISNKSNTEQPYVDTNTNFSIISQHLNYDNQNVGNNGTSENQASKQLSKPPLNLPEKEINSDYQNINKTYENSTTISRIHNNTNQNFITQPLSLSTDSVFKEYINRYNGTQTNQNNSNTPQRQNYASRDIGNNYRSQIDASRNLTKPIHQLEDKIVKNVNFQILNATNKIINNVTEFEDEAKKSITPQQLESANESYRIISNNIRGTKCTTNCTKNNKIQEDKYRYIFFKEIETIIPRFNDIVKIWSNISRSIQDSNLERQEIVVSLKDITNELKGISLRLENKTLVPQKLDSTNISKNTTSDPKCTNNVLKHKTKHDDKYRDILIKILKKILLRLDSKVNTSSGINEILNSWSNISRSIQDTNLERHETVESLKDIANELKSISLRLRFKNLEEEGSKMNKKRKYNIQERNFIFQNIENRTQNFKNISHVLQDKFPDKRSILKSLEDKIRIMIDDHQDLENTSNDASKLFQDFNETIIDLQYIILSRTYLYQEEDIIMQNLKDVFKKWKSVRWNLDDRFAVENIVFESVKNTVKELKVINSSQNYLNLQENRILQNLVGNINTFRNTTLSHNEDLKQGVKKIFQALEGSSIELRNVNKDNDFSNHTIQNSNHEVTFYQSKRQKKNHRAGSCQLVLQEDLDLKREPLILSADGKDIVVPDVRTITLQSSVKKEFTGLVLQKDFSNLNTLEKELDEGYAVINMENRETLLLACPWKPGINVVDGEVECRGGQLKVEGKRVSASTTSCDRTYATSAVKLTKTPCGTGNEVKVEIGFEVTEDGVKEWVPEITVCHNVDGMYSLYSVHNLHGNVVKGKMTGGNRKSFTVGNSLIYRGVNPDLFYTKKSEVETLNQILGSGAGKSLIKGNQYIARGHLSPVADFVYFSGQMSTMFYVNTAPQWQSFNGGNWVNVEKTMRDLAEVEGDTLLVYTGTYGVQSLTYKKMTVEFYLAQTEEGQEVIPVPEVFWKLVTNPRTAACIVAIGHNDVFATEPPEPLCDPQTTEWPTLTDLDAGYTYFCDYQSFKDIESYIPQVDCNEILMNPDNQKR